MASTSRSSQRLPCAPAASLLRSPAFFVFPSACSRLFGEGGRREPCRSLAYGKWRKPQAGCSARFYYRKRETTTESRQLRGRNSYESCRDRWPERLSLHCESLACCCCSPEGSRQYSSFARHIMAFKFKCKSKYLVSGHELAPFMQTINSEGFSDVFIPDLERMLSSCLFHTVVTLVDECFSFRDDCNLDDFIKRLKMCDQCQSTWSRRYGQIFVPLLTTEDMAGASLQSKIKLSHRSLNIRLTVAWRTHKLRVR